MYVTYKNNVCIAKVSVIMRNFELKYTSYTREEGPETREKALITFIYMNTS